MSLAKDLCHSLETGLANPCVHLVGRTARDAFDRSLQAAIRDIEAHPRGKLFRRFLEYGPPNPDDPRKLDSDGETILSDAECGECVQFIFSHMVNRFKGELAELLAIAPCLRLMTHMERDGRLPAGVQLYLGDTIQERRKTGQQNVEQWEGFTKGADGLIVDRMPRNSKSGILVRAIIEVKSMPRSEAKLGAQLRHHVERLGGGLKLDGTVWEGSQVQYRSPVYITVTPSAWKLSRECYYLDGTLIYPPVDEPPASDCLEQIGRGRWKVTLAWSKEAIEQAAYEMTYWYMSQVGTAIYKSKPLPKGWDGMSLEDAGYNAIKMMLYYVMLRYLTPPQLRRATKLYNAYSFGYPRGVDAKEMLWPEDLPHRDTAR